MKQEDAEIIAEAALETYKQRLSTRLMPLILRQFDDFQPAFVAQVMKALCVTGVAPQEPIIYPEGTKFFQRQSNACYLLMEQKPQVRTLHFLNDTQQEKSFELTKSHWRLALPYVLMAQVYTYKEGIWTCGGTFVGYSNKPVRAFDDFVYQVNLPNVNDYAVCNGKMFSAKGSVTEQAEQYVGHFWQGVFTTDWSDGYKDSPVGKVETWERLTNKDPLAVLKTRWQGGISLLTFLGKTGLKCDDFMKTAAGYTREVISQAAQEAVRQVTEQCRGVDTEALDKVLLEQMTKYLTERK